MKILYIEDEEFIRENAVEYLEFYCDNVYEAVDGIDGYEKYKEIKPHIIICDIMMPNLNGLELIEKIRAEDKTTQVIVATARVDTEFLLKAVELRLVKYLTKPITEKKLIPVLEEAIKFIEEENTTILNLEENTKYDLLNNTLIQNDTIVKLTKKELLFLEICAKNHKRAVTYEELENYVWEGYMTPDAKRSLVKEIRRKLPKDALENISGIGYKLKTL